MKIFNSNIKKVLEKLSYDFYVVQQDFRIKCPCVDATSKEADPNCPKCLSTGHKIKIRKIRGASQDKKVTFRNNALNEQSLSINYYINAKYPVYERNLIIDEDDVFHIYRIEKKHTANKELVYYKAAVHSKKANSRIILKNFRNIVKGAVR